MTRFLLLPVLVAGCSMPYSTRERLDDQIKSYRNTVRWHEMEKAAIVVNEPLRTEYLKRSEKIRSSIQIVDCRVLSTVLGSNGETADVTMEIDYHILPSTRIKTVVDRQKWQLFKADMKNYWLLMTLPPEFD
jgi:hypothetical protein